MKRIAMFLSGMACATAARAGFGGMGSVDDSGGGGVSLEAGLLAFAFFGGLFYAAYKYGDRLDNGVVLGRIAIGIVVLLILMGIFGD